VITHIEIKGYKTIDDLDLDLGRVNVLIGENGAGKSNILEVLAIAGAAAANKLDNEFLASRGIRVTKPEFMRPAFPDSDMRAPISVSFGGDDVSVEFSLTNDNAEYSKWQAHIERQGELKLDKNGFSEAIRNFVQQNVTDDDEAHKAVRDVLDQIASQIRSKIAEVGSNKKAKKEVKKSKISFDITLQLDEKRDFAKYFAESDPRMRGLIDALKGYVIYSPENTSLRAFQREGQIEPLGVNGEGLFKLLSVLSSEKYANEMQSIKRSLGMLGWFSDFLPNLSENRIELKDRYLDQNRTYLDQSSANEGFLFLLFYFTLFSTELTPHFFAIDNIDASLNPKLCERLTKELVSLAKKNNKQVILTTHNPAVLDGLNLNDDEQRLFVVSRNRTGCTRVKRVAKPSLSEGAKPVRMSEMFLKGVLGGLPKGF
jgi:predicted ATPase